MQCAVLRTSTTQGVVKVVDLLPPARAAKTASGEIPDSPKNHLHNNGLIFINVRNAPYCGRDRRLSRFERFLIDQRDAGCEGPSGFMV
jgi:hypothetical protein